MLSEYMKLVGKKKSDTEKANGGSDTEDSTKSPVWNHLRRKDLTLKIANSCQTPG